MRINVIDGYVEDADRLRAALEASCVVGTWAWDHIQGVVVYDEGAAQLLTGNPELADRAIKGQIALAAVHPADLTWLMDHMLRAVQSGGLVLAEYRVFKADGSVRWLLSRGRTYRDATGRPARSNGILMDITELRDGGERYVLAEPPMGGDPLERMADLAIALKRTLTDDMAPEIRNATDLVLLALGRALAHKSRS